MDKYQNSVKELSDDKLVALAEGYRRIVKIAWLICGTPCAFLVLMGLYGAISITGFPFSYGVLFIGVGLLLFALFAKPINDYKKTGEAATAEVSKRGLDHKISKRKAENQETRKYILISIVSLLVIIALFVFVGRITSSDNSSDKGYWGSDGYYNPSPSEMDDVWDDVNDWMDKNWD